MRNKPIEYTEGSDNIYEDMGFIDAEKRLAKAKLAIRIETLIEERGLTQVQAAKLLGIRQPKISALINGRLGGFSMEKLITFLNLLNDDVEIVIRTKRRRKNKIGHLKVAFT